MRNRSKCQGQGIGGKKELKQKMADSHSPIDASVVYTGKKVPHCIWFKLVVRAHFILAVLSKIGARTNQLMRLKIWTRAPALTDMA